MARVDMLRGGAAGDYLKAGGLVGGGGTELCWPLKGGLVAGGGDLMGDDGGEGEDRYERDEEGEFPGRVGSSSWRPQ